MARLDGKVAIVTGAASGIGAGTAAVFAEHGARLVLVDRDSAGLESVRARLDAPASPAIAVCGDVADAATIERVVAAALTTISLGSVMPCCEKSLNTKSLTI